MLLTSDRLANYAQELSFDDLPEVVVDQTKKLVIDSLGCSIAAFSSPPSKVLRTTYRNQTPPEATVLGTHNELPTEYAALVNATMGRYLDFNDCYTTGSSACHPSDHIPALLAVAEHEGASGRDLIEAIVLTYEIQCRGVDTGALWNRGFDYVTWGAHAAGLGVGKLMGLSTEELVNALGIVGTSSNGLLISRLGEVSMWKAVAQPYATHNAIQACQMARNGLTGPTKLFEGVEERDGEGGFFYAVSDGPVELEALGGRDGDFRVMETSFKAFACGYFTHPSITAVLDIVREHDLAPEDLESIDVETFDQAIQVYASGPEKWASDINRETADHSLPYNVAVAAIDREVMPHQYEEEYLRDDQVHDVMQRISAVEDEELTEYRLDHPRHVPARATIVANGETYVNRVNFPIGHPERPMSMDDIVEKFENLVDDLTNEQMDTTIEICKQLESQDDFDGLTNALTI